MLDRFWIALSAFPLAVLCFNPAVPSNDTSSLASVSSASLILNWSPYGQLVYANGLARVLRPSESSVVGFRAVLQRYSESNYTNPQNPGPPWIALISCDDTNSSDSSTTTIPAAAAAWTSPEQATQSGAIATILYSTTSETCLYDLADFGSRSNPYLSDVYVTTSRAAAVDLLERFNAISYPILWHRGDTLRIDNSRIQNQITNLGGSAAPPILPSNSTSTSYVNDYVIGTILLPFPAPPTLVLGSWRNRMNSGISPTNKIVVYSVAACVAGILATVMLLSAIKAFRRQPEYVRSTVPNAPLSRVQGLGKAVLDTIPVIKFSFLSGKTENEAKTAEEGKSSVELQEQNKTKPTTQHVEDPESKDVTGDDTHVLTSTNDDHTCPICLIDFDQEDDIRVLPCDARHTFHDACITPWLLDVSSLCPLCRLDLAKTAQPVGVEGESDPATANSAATQADAAGNTTARGQQRLAVRFREYIRERRRNINRAHE